MSKYNRVVHKDGKHLEVDVYDVLEAFNVTCPALQHLIKKALCVGIRGHKDESQDLQDIIDSANRAIGLAEDRVDGEMLENMDSMTIKTSEITGMDPNWLTKDNEKRMLEIEAAMLGVSTKPVSADTAKYRSIKQKKLDLISKIEKTMGAEK